MQKIKKILISVFVLTILLVFSGCATVNYRIDRNDDGSIYETFGVELDVDAIKAAGHSDAEILNLKNKIEDDFEKSIVTFSLRYSFFLAETKAYVDENFEYTNGWDSNKYVLKLKFNSIYMYYLFYNISSDTPYEPTQTIEEGVFFKKIIYEDTTIYNEITLYDIADYLTDFPEFDVDDVDCTYTYATPNYRWRGEGVDVTSYDDNNYTYTWNLSSSDWNEPIRLYFYVANEVSWLVVITFSTLLVCAIMLVIAIIKVKKKNKN